MPKVFKVLSGKELIKILLSLGFTEKSQKGSHVKLVIEKGVRKITAIVPNHKELKQKTMLDTYNQL